MAIHWRWAHFSKLNAEELYQILQLREQVFVLEQQCLYQDIDGIDRKAWHLSAANEANELIAYLRVIAPGIKFNEPSIGRVVTKASYRGLGLGKSLLKKGIQQTHGQFPQTDIRISAQRHLADFYRSFRFESIGEQYLEDGIPHIEMILKYT